MEGFPTGWTIKIVPHLPQIFWYGPLLLLEEVAGPEAAPELPAEAVEDAPVEGPLEEGSVEEGDDALPLQLPLHEVAPRLADLEARRAERVPRELDLSGA